jgi:hypothetical protein
MDHDIVNTILFYKFLTRDDLFKVTKHVSKLLKFHLIVVILMNYE